MPFVRRAFRVFWQGDAHDTGCGSVYFGKGVLMILTVAAFVGKEMLVVLCGRACSVKIYS